MTIMSLPPALMFLLLQHPTRDSCCKMNQSGEQEKVLLPQTSSLKRDIQGRGRWFFKHPSRNTVIIPHPQERNNNITFQKY